MNSSEQERLERIKSLPTEDISIHDCAYCQQLRGERRRYRPVMEPCEMHGTADASLEENPPMSEVYHTTKWLKFIVREHGQRKTLSIEVINTSDQHLGWISWYNPWRQYVFDPTLDAPTTFNNNCLQGIVDVLTRLNEEHKAKETI